MDTVTLATGEDVRRMSYAEIAEWRGVSIGAARRLTQRHRWHKQIGNDGFVTVSVPATYFASRRKPVATTRRSDSPSDSRSDKPVAPDAVLIEAIRTFEKAIDTLTGQLAQAHARADRAEEKATALQVELIDLRITERVADRAVAEVVELRQRLDGAERRLDDALAAQRKAADELKGLQAAVDQQRTMGLPRRLRWALRGR